MLRSPSSLLLAALALALPLRLAAQAPAPPPAPDIVLPAGVDLVTVDVLVLDDQGRPVEGLRQEDFRVKEDGRAQTVGVFEAVVVPASAPSRPRVRVSTNVGPRPPVERSFVIVFDDANISLHSTAHARRSIAAFVRNLRAGDEVMIVPTAGGAWWTGRMPEDLPSVLAYVDRLEGRFRPDASAARIWDHEAMAIWRANDRLALAQVARRWFENNVIPEAYPVDREARGELEVSPGLGLIRAKAQETYNAAVNRLRLTLDTVTRIAESLGGVRGRKDLLLASEGFIMDPSQPEFRAVVQAARRTNTAVHFFDVRSAEGALGQAGMPGGGAEFGAAALEQDALTALALAARASDGARSVAIDTGGTVNPSTGGLGNVMSRVAEQSRAYYLLGFTSTNTRRDGSFRKISIEVMRPNVTVRARRGYYAPRGEGDRRREDPDRLDPAVRAGLDAPVAVAALPLRLTSYVFGSQPDGSTLVLLLGEAEVGTFLAPREGKVTAALETFVVVHGRDTNTLDKQEQLVELNIPEAHWDVVRRGGVALRREFRLPPGAYQARLLVRERSGGRLGTVHHEFEVPAVKGLRISTPILTDAFQGNPGELPRPLPVARRTFAAGSRLGCSYEVYGAAPDAVAGGPRVTAAHSVRSVGGTVVTTSPTRALRPTSIDRLGQVIVFTAPSDPGDYEFVLDLRDESGGTTLRSVEPFTVVPAAP